MQTLLMILKVFYLDTIHKPKQIYTRLKNKEYKHAWITFTTSIYALILIIPLYFIFPWYLSIIFTAFIIAILWVTNYYLFFQILHKELENDNTQANESEPFLIKE